MSGRIALQGALLKSVLASVNATILNLDLDTRTQQCTDQFMGEILDNNKALIPHPSSQPTNPDNLDPNSTDSYSLPVMTPPTSTTTAHALPNAVKMNRKIGMLNKAPWKDDPHDRPRSESIHHRPSFPETCDEIRMMADNHTRNAKKDAEVWRTLYTYTKMDLPVVEGKANKC
eukprot:CAMPEP_0201695020 /NCGR_PEP_ID=MMETSP0578-20130828/7101_1 /ASSEMBLY_ACC=CAM_ASM_000663 /TAXON_ID=267565 /ORGANISM="Skeletonema grethea, Strain CCMP 1804" /LENGTH=172 /DNA_ID=CAMNT_0048180793 /DNA_START=10 /DNA_END=529 /DNA_ORIENTATION=+